MIISCLKRRSDFLAVFKNKVFCKKRAVLVQVCPFKALGCKTKHPDILFLYGITASKKVGNAVERNRAKRRIRAWLQNHLSSFEVYSDFFLKKGQTLENPFILSKRTLNQILKKKSSFFELDKDSENAGVAVVFIANSSTPNISWDQFCEDMSYSIKSCIEKLLH